MSGLCGRQCDQARGFSLLTRKCRSGAAIAVFRERPTIKNRKVSLRLPENCSALQKSRRSRIRNARLLVEDGYCLVGPVWGQGRGAEASREPLRSQEETRQTI